MTQDHSAKTASNSSELGELIYGHPRLAAGVGAAIIIAATLLAYVPALRSGFIWDDDYYVTANPLLRNWEGLQRIWTDVLPHPSEYPLPQYYPLTHTSFWIEYRLWGLNPTGYHLVNIILHTCNALLVWLILRKLSVPGAWLAAAIFALHPVNVESVAWISERKNVLSLLLFLTSLYVYLRYAGLIPGAEPSRQKPATLGEEDAPFTWFTLPNDPPRLYALAAVLFVCALFSKTVTSSMPVVVLLIIWWKRGKISVKDVLPLLPLFVVGVAMGSLTAYMEQVRVGVAARAEDWHFAPTAIGQFGARCIIAGKALWFYIAKLLLPYGLTFNYRRWTIDPSDLAQYLYLASAVLVLVLLALGRRWWGRGPLVAGLIYGITLFPALGFVDVWPMRYSFVADHFVYLSSIALIALAAAIAVRFLALEALAGVASIVLLLLLGTSFVHGKIFHDPDTLWKETWTRSGKTSWLAANNYGSLLLQRGNLNYAEQWFQEVLRLRPDHPEARRNLARIAIQRAARARRAAATTAPASQATTQAATRPTTQQIADYYQQAIDYYRDAIRVQPNYVDAHAELAQLLLSLGRQAEAAEQFHKVLELYPRHELAHEELGDMALKAGKLDQALEHFIRAAEINPDSVYAHVQLGTVLLQKGLASDGFAQWDEALRLSPGDPNLPNQFGATMASNGEYRKAVEYFQQALQIDPKNVEVTTNLGVVAAKLGATDAARKAFEHALKLDPQFAKARENLAALNAGKLAPATTRPASQLSPP